MPEFPLHEYLGVASRQNQPISTFFHDSHIVWYSVALARSDDFVHMWILMFVPPRSENKLEVITFSFPKIWCLAEFQFELILWIVNFQLFGDFFVLYQSSGLASWVPSFRVSLMSFIGVVLNDEASHILLLETPTNYSRTGCWFVQSWSNAHILKENCLLLWTSHAKVSLAWIVGCHFASEPTNLTIFDGSQCFWYSVAVARSDDFVHLWLLLFVPPSCENKWQPFNFFPQILLSCGNPVWNDIMDRWFLIFLDFFVLYQWKSLLSWITSFLVSLGWVSWV